MSECVVSAQVCNGGVESIVMSDGHTEKERETHTSTLPENNRDS